MKRVRKRERQRFAAVNRLSLADRRYRDHVAQKETPSARRARHTRQSSTGASASGVCGVCGVFGVRSKTHVPPQAVGNRADLAMRRAWLTVEGQMEFGRPLSGGIWLFGLCPTCNQAAGKFDAAYRDFAQLVLPGVPTRIHAPSGYRWRTSAGEIRPGAIARSVLSGMFALNPMLRQRCPAVAEMLGDSTSASVSLGDEFQLRLAAFSGFRARVTGSYGGWYLRVRGNQRSDGVNTAASVAFRPLAWHLAFSRTPNDPPDVFGPLLDVEEWPDVSDWAATDPDEAVALSDALPTGLPLVDLPDQHPRDGWRWTWLLNDEICPMIDADVETDRDEHNRR